MTIKIHRAISVGTFSAWKTYHNDYFQGTKVEAVDPFEPPTYDVYRHIESANESEQSFKFSKVFPEKMASISSITVYAWLRTLNGSSVKLKITDSLGTWASGAFGLTGQSVLYSFTRTTLSDNSTPWTETLLRNGAVEYHVQEMNASWTRCYQFWCETNYTPTVEETIFSRMAVSHKLHEQAQRHEFMSLQLPLKAFDMRRMDDFNLQHPELPAESGESSGLKNWELAKLRLFGFEYHADNLKLIAHFLDLRNYLALFRDTAISPYDVESDVYEPLGPLRLDTGVTRSMVRASKGTIAQNAPSAYRPDVGYIVEVANNVERIGPLGTLIEDVRYQYAKNSSFINWTTGNPDNWSIVGSPNASEVTNKIFHPDVVRGSDTPHGLNLNPAGAGDNGYNQDTTYAWQQDTDGVFSIDHEDISGDELTVALRRNSDNWWWNPVTPGWQSGFATWDLPVAPSGYIVRDYEHFEAPTSYTGTFLIYIRARIASQDVTIHHVQLEGNTNSAPCSLGYPTSHIISDEEGSAVKREEDVLKCITQPGYGRRILHPERGTLFFKVYLPYGPGDLIGVDTTKNLMMVSYNFLTTGDEDLFQIYYDVDSGRWTFHFDALTDAINVVQMTTGWTTVAARWISSEEELSLPAGSIDLFIDGSKGITGAKGTVVEDIGDTDFHYGTNDAAYSTLNGYISSLWSSPRVFTDTEIEAWHNYLVRNL